MHLKIAFLVYFLCGCFYESLYIAGAEPQTHPPEWIPVDFSVSSLMLWNVHTARLSLQYYQSNHRGWGCLPPLAGCLSVCIGARCFSFWISIQSSYTCHFSVRKYCSSIRMNLRLLNVLQHCGFEVVYVGEGQSVWVDMEMMEWM